MRWIRALLRILGTVFVLALVIKTVFVYLPEIKNDWFRDRQKVQQEKSPDLTGKEPPVEDNGSVGEQEDNTPSTGDTDPLQTGSGEEKGERQLFLTQEELTAMMNISLSDRVTGISILGKMKREDLDKLTELAENGVTLEEMEQLREVLKTALSEKEYEKLYDLLIRNKKLYAEGKLSK